MAIENEEVVEQVAEQPAAESTPASEPARTPSIHETVEAAFDVVQEHEEKSEPRVERAERKRDPITGQFVPTKAEKDAAAAAEKLAAASKGQPADKEPKDKPAADPTARAPQAWRALAREHWAKLDQLGESGKAIKEELVRREREVNQRLAQDAPARELANAFEQVVRPFLPLIPPGRSPLQSIHGLMQTAAVLQTGSMQQRAVIAANIIRGYGIDIDLLAQALDGSTQPNPGRPAPGGYDPRVDELAARLAERDRRDAERAQAQEQAELQSIQENYAKFAETHEFFEDVREDMADIIRVAADRGLAIDDEEAYNRAISFHPELAELLRQRQDVERATNPNGSTALSRRAAVSVKPRPASRPPSAVPASDLRGTIAAAFDKVSSR